MPGGGYYDRDDDVVPVIVGQEYSQASQQIMEAKNKLDPSMDPKRWATKKLISTHHNPVVVAIDVTGSMGDWSKILYDKLPMFYGQILVQNYLDDVCMSVCAVGDHTCDDAPLQIGEFEQGIRLDQTMKKMWLEKGGGGSGEESYELAAYFFARHCELQNSKLPFFFITGDERMYSEIKEKTVIDLMGVKEISQTLSSPEIWKELMTKFNVFYLHKPSATKRAEVKVLKQWNEVLGSDRLLQFENPKAIVDIMLGAIAITSGKRTLETYVYDMKERGQSDDRIDEVRAALKPYAENLWRGGIVQSFGGFQIMSSEERRAFDDNLTAEKERFKKMFLENASQGEFDLVQFFKSKDVKFLPSEFICPLTEEVMVDPVITCDGQTFERSAIELWFEKGNNTSPTTNLRLASKNLIQNFAIKKLIQDFATK